MDLEFKRDFKAAQGRWEAFWKGELTDRPAISFVVPKAGAPPGSKPPYMSGAEGDFAPVIEQVLAWAGSHEFVGEAIPFCQVEFGPDHLAHLLGAERRVDPATPETSWAVPFIEDWDEAEIRFQREGYWWQRTAAYIRALRQRCDGKLLIAAPSLSANLDALAGLRGGERLLMDLLECPEKVQRGLDQVCRALTEIVAALAEELDYARWGSINRHGMYSRGKAAIPQCDFSCMISTEMFREFAVPALRREMALLDAVEYHLDGPGALRHLEALCELDDLDVIQWVPGAGNGEALDWMHLHRRIDTLGKGQILGGNPERMRRLWREYRSRKLFFHSWANTPQEARDQLAAWGNS